MGALLPRAARAGEIVGIAAPSGAVDAMALERGLAELRALGFRTRLASDATDQWRFAAGTVERRARELRELFLAEDVAAIVCARGGAGAGPLLRYLEPDFLREHWKPFVGCSDITWLHLQCAAARVVSVHGPMVARDLAQGTYDRSSLLHALSGEGTPYVSPPGQLRALRPGEAEGVLGGGCLSILASAAGTPWALRPTGEDAILFLEDVSEPPYRIDRMLFQLRQSGALEGVSGIVFGEMKGCRPEGLSFALEDVLLDALVDFRGPVAIGLPSGHTSGGAVSLPFGVGGWLKCAGDGVAEFEVTEAATA